MYDFKLIKLFIYAYDDHLLMINFFFFNRHHQKMMRLKKTLSRIVLYITVYYTLKSVKRLFFTTIMCFENNSKLIFSTILNQPKFISKICLSLI